VAVEGTEGRPEGRQRFLGIRDWVAFSFLEEGGAQLSVQVHPQPPIFL
jgi:hypothetical protein